MRSAKITRLKADTSAAPPEGDAIGGNTEDRHDPWLHPSDQSAERCRTRHQFGGSKLDRARRRSRHQARDPDADGEEMLTIRTVETTRRLDRMVDDSGEMQRSVEAIPAPGERGPCRYGCQPRIDTNEEQSNVRAEQVG